METVVEWCRTERLCTVWLHASPLYESMGFLPTNEMRLIL